MELVIFNGAVDEYSRILAQTITGFFNAIHNTYEPKYIKSED